MYVPKSSEWGDFNQHAILEYQLVQSIDEMPIVTPGMVTDVLVCPVGCITERAMKWRREKFIDSNSLVY